MQIDLKYIDPSYTIRSMPANPRDSSFCLLLGHNAVHAGMAGRTNMLVGYWKQEFTHIPLGMAVSGRKKIDPDGRCVPGTAHVLKSAPNVSYFQTFGKS
jgi:6-phosphofructokinase 1